MNQICPWCQTEIVWDEETGPEDSCPHCLNELGEYRSVQVKLETPDRGSETKAAQSVDDSSDEPGEIEGLFEAPDLLDTFEFDDDSHGLAGFEEAVEPYIDEIDALECVHCKEFMVFAGEQQIKAEQFAAFIPNGVKEPFLKAPYTMQVHVCAACFQISFRLSEEDRMSIMTRLVRD